MSDEEYLAKRDFSDWWGKVKVAIENAGQKVTDWFETNKPKMEAKIKEAVAKAKADFGKFKEVVVDGVHDLWVKVDETGVKVISDTKGVYAKVLAAANDLDESIRAQVKAAIEKY